jgi:putative transcriptional regulator
MIRSHLQDLMQRLDFSATELARRAGVNRSTVTALAKERTTRIDLGDLERICILLGCQVGDLLEIVPGEAPPLNNSKGVP